MFVKFSDTRGHVDGFASRPGVSPLIAFWSHALAAAMFASLLIWRLAAGARQPGHRLLLGAFALTACWAWLEAIAPASAIASYSETARNLVWVGLLYSLYASSPDGRQQGVRLVYGAVSAVLGMQLIVTTVILLGGASAPVEETERILRITGAAGSLVLVHNLYGQAAPSSRSNIRFAMLALALSWSYDLNFYTISYLEPAAAGGLSDWRGIAVALTAPLFALAARHEDDWRIRLSRAATFQSLSLLAICAYFAVMAVLATALQGAGSGWLRTVSIALLAVMIVAAMVLLPSARARSWAKVKIAKHLFEHRYDYRTEWLRFTDALAETGPVERPLAERVVKAFADILDAPGGLLVECDGSGAFVTGASWNWHGRTTAAVDPHAARQFWDSIALSKRVLELDSVRAGWSPQDRAIVPEWLIEETDAWVAVPLVSKHDAVGLVLLAAPDYRRALDWEDFDLLRTAGRQAASSIAEAQGQMALSEAQRFDEFSRRFAFILHDIKNLVSQLSLLTHNAERHSGNAEFRGDMIATLKSSIGKMNDLLARLSPQSAPRSNRIEPQPVREIVIAAIAARRGRQEVMLIGDSDLWAEVDGPALEQAIGHLVQNAVEASPADEPVTVRIDGGDGEVTIAICDKGRGMDSDFVRSQLFQPFASTKPAGFGIGAFEARSLVIAMGGQLSVVSRPGEGTQFLIRLKRAATAVQPLRRSA